MQRAIAQTFVNCLVSNLLKRFFAGTELELNIHSDVTDNKDG